MNPFSAKKIWLIASVMLAVSIVLPSCKSNDKKEGKLPVFKVMEVKAKNVPVYLQIVGQATGIPTVEIRARVAGYLQNWTFKEGSIVKKGQLLFTIEQNEYINNVHSSEADLASRIAAWEKAKLDVARLKPLLSTNAISQNDYDKAVTTEQEDRAAVDAAKASLEQAKLNLSYTTITSPITGYIGACSVNPGNLVGKGESTILTTVSAVDPIYVNFQMNETDYLKIMHYLDEYKIDLQKASDSFKIFLTMSDGSEYKYPGRIDFIDRAVNTSTGTIAVRAVLPNPEGLIKPGSFQTVNLVLMENENGIVIPQSATMQIQGKMFAFLVDKDNIVTRVPIITGRSIGQNFTVNNGIKIGDKVMLEGFQKFKEGLQIQPEMVNDTIQLPQRPH
jgi:membrane fusion protein, multidrug efflux system